MEFLHILFAIFALCISTTLCFSIGVWCLFKSIDRTIVLLVNYYTSFNARFKNVEKSISILENNINTLPLLCSLLLIIHEHFSFLWLLWVVRLPPLSQFQALSLLSY